MGAINDLLKNDTDGKIRHSILRGITVLTVLVAAVLVLFVSGILWRLFTGADMEAWGIRVWNKIDPGKSEVAKADLPKTSPTAPIGPTGLEAKDMVILTSWFNLGAIEPQRCLDTTREALSRPGFTGTAAMTSTDGLAIGHLALRNDDGRSTQVMARCMNLGGFFAVSLLSAGPNATNARMSLDAASGALSQRERERVVGPSLLSAQETFTGWRGADNMTLQGCVHASNEVLANRLALQDIVSSRSREGAVLGHRGFRKDRGSSVAGVVTQCGEANGMAVVFWTIYGVSQPAREINEQIGREMSTVMKDSTYFKMVGSAGKLSQASFSYPLTLASVEDCTRRVQEVIGSINGRLTSTQANTVFSTLDAGSFVGICARDGDKTSLTGTISGFVYADLVTQRDGFRKAFDPVRRQ